MSDDETDTPQTFLGRLLAHPLLRSGGVYFTANVINAGLPFLLLPILTRYLTPADYGIVAMFGVLVGILIPFIGVNTHAAVTRQYFRRDEIDFPQYVGNALGIAGTGFVVVSLVLLVFGTPLARLTDFPAEWMWSVPVFAFAHFLVNLRLTVYQFEQRPVPYAGLQVGLTTIELALALLLIVRLGLDWEGRVLSRVAATGAFALLAIALLYKGRWVRMSFNREYVKHALVFGIPLIPHTLGQWAMTLADRVFITELVSIDETGLYTVGVQIATAIGLVTTAFSAAWTPWLFERLKADTDADRLKAVRASWVYGICLIALGLFVGLVGPPALTILVGDQFVTAGRYIPWLAAAKVFHGLYQIASSYLFYVERTGVLTKITIVAAAINLVLNYVLVKAFGGVGAAQATLVAYAAYFVLTLAAAKVLYPMSWNPLRAD